MTDIVPPAQRLVASIRRRIQHRRVDRVDAELRRQKENGVSANGADDHAATTSTEIWESLPPRVDWIEQNMPAVGEIGAKLGELGQAVNQMQQQIAWLAQQRSVAEQQLERHTRATALDLAIKAAPGADSTSLTALFEAFVALLKAA